MTLLRKICALIGIGLILSVMSEIWFYPVNLSLELIEVLVAYGVLGYLFLLTLITFKVSSFSGFFLAACLFSFAIEGIPVPVLFSGLPFTIVWTSMAWHAALSVTLGWLGYRIVMSRKSWMAASLYNVSLGLLMGVWGGYFWNVQEGGDTVQFKWLDPEPFYAQFAVGLLLFVTGHFILDQVASNWPKPARYEFRGFMLTATLLFCLSSLVVMFPFSLLLPALAALCLWKLNHLKDDGDWTRQVLRDQIPPSRYFLSLLLLGGSYLGYSLIYFNQIPLETNAIYASIFGLVSIGLFVRGIFARRN